MPRCWSPGSGWSRSGAPPKPVDDGDERRLLLDELDEGAERGLRVDERDRRPPRAWARLLVDDLATGVLDRLQRGRAIGHAVADVVHALAALVEVLRDG